MHASCYVFFVVPGWKNPNANLPPLDTSGLWVPDSGRSTVKVSVAPARSTPPCRETNDMANRTGTSACTMGVPKFAIAG